MNKNRLEAFSDGVIAIIVTVMVLELKIPTGGSFQDFKETLPMLQTYIFSFVMVWIYWNNHHHLFQSVKHISGKVLLANGHLLFWLSLLPFTTGWLGRVFEPLPVACLGVVLLMSGVAYYTLSKILVKLHDVDSTIVKAVGRDLKGVLSLILYLIGILLSFNFPEVSVAIYVFVALTWLIPDDRIERFL
jgi:uncharacterized membrane protein